MESTQYNDFTKDLKERLINYQEVIGLIAVGSMAKQHYLPDQWSDHDFFVVVETGYQQNLRQDLAWLPMSEQIALSFRETEHGLKVLYTNGHLIEFAIFDIKEIYLAKINSYRIIIDKANIKEDLAKIKKLTAKQSNLSGDTNLLIGQFITNILVGIGRYRRGEKISAHQLVKISAVKGLITLILKYLPIKNDRLIDDIDPLRRFELIQPDLGKEFEDVLLMPVPEAANQLLNILQRKLKGCFTIQHKEAIKILQKFLTDND